MPLFGFPKAQPSVWLRVPLSGAQLNQLQKSELN
jgi:hypothetical protein